MAAVLAWLAAAVGTAVAQPVPDALDSGHFQEAEGMAKYAVIIAGPSVDEDIAARFRGWALELHGILVADYGYTADRVVLLYDRGAGGGSGAEAIDGAATLAGIRAALAELAARARAGDQVTLFLIGHGTGEGVDAKFNIRGPDITGTDLAAMLADFEGRHVAVVNTTSASYGFATALSSPGRVVISATRSASERYDTVFPRYFIAALAGRSGDRDKNERVSLLEAFDYARASVAQWYEEQGRLTAEHAGLDDNGDGSFALRPLVTAADGRVAEVAYLDSPLRDDNALGAEARALRAEMQALERAVIILRGRKDDFLAADYWFEMERLLMDLARVTARFDRLAGEAAPAAAGSGGVPGH